MALNEIDLKVDAEPVQWLVEGLIPQGYITFVAAREGVGKTTILTGLAWQMSRPEGQGEFLGQAISRGRSIFVNTDAPDGQARTARHWVDRHRNALPDGDLDLITILEPSGAGLTPDDLQALEQMVRERNISALIIDSFMGSFPGVDGNKGDKVMGPMLALRDLAARTGTAVIITDHLPKPSKGEKNGDRGVIGSVAKQAQARAALIFSRVDPQEVAGRDVLRVFTEKQNFAPSKYPFGLEVIRTEGDRPEVQFLPYRLPDEAEGQSGSGKAKRAVRDRLENGGSVDHQALVQLAMAAGNIRERMAKQAVHDVLEDLRDQLELSTLPGRGAPRAYRWRTPIEEMLRTDCPSPETGVQDDAELEQPDIAPVGEPGAPDDGAAEDTEVLTF